MALDDDFQKAQADVQALTKRPGNDELLDLYALYKQATSGDVAGKRPGMLDLKGRAKHDAWETKKGMAKDAAKQAYVTLAGRLVSSYK